MSLRRIKQEIVEELKAELYNIIEEALVEESKTVKINGLEWMTTNLDDVRSVPLIEDDEEWEKAGDEGRPACCYYNNKRGNGVLYNWFALKHLEKGGWRVPTYKDFKTLEGQTIKNRMGVQFNGSRYYTGKFENTGMDEYWWSSSEKKFVFSKEKNVSDAWYWYISASDELGTNVSNKSAGFSVRLVK